MRCSVPGESSLLEAKKEAAAETFPCARGRGLAEGTVESTRTVKRFGRELGNIKRSRGNWSHLGSNQGFYARISH